MNKRKELLKKHVYAISQGKDGKCRTYLPDKDNKSGRKMIKRNTQESLEDVIVSYWKAEEENPTVEDIFVEWADRKLKNGEIGKGSYERYHMDFKRFFSDFGKEKIKTFSEEQIEDFLIDSIVKLNLTQKGYSNLRLIIYGIFKTAKRKKYITFGITELVNNMEISKKIFRYSRKKDSEEIFDDSEFEKIEAYLIQHMDLINLGLLLMFFTGIRVGELASLKWSDYDGNSIKIQRTEIRYKNDTGSYVYEIKESPKTEAGIRDVIIPPQCIWLMKKIRAMNPFGEYIFEKNGIRIKTYSYRKRLYYICDQTKIPRRSPHKIRKTYASILLDNQVSEKLITDLMGHTDIQCTNKYYGRNRKSNEEKAEILNNIPEFQIING